MDETLPVDITCDETLPAGDGVVGTVAGLQEDGGADGRQLRVTHLEVFHRLLQLLPGTLSCLLRHGTVWAVHTQQHHSETQAPHGATPFTPPVLRCHNQRHAG